MKVTNGIRLLFKTIRTLKENEETKASAPVLPNYQSVVPSGTCFGWPAVQSICGIAEQIKTELEELGPKDWRMFSALFGVCIM